MKTQPEIQNPGIDTTHSQSLFFTANQIKVMAALLLIATGLVFTLTFSGRIGWGSPWWVIYIAIPSLMLLYAAGNAVVQGRKGIGAAAGTIFLGLIGVAVAIIMVVDPTWSFTQTWRLDETFPFLRVMAWDPIWQWALVIGGAGSVVAAILRRAVGVGVFGALLMVVGGTFLLNLSWDSVWPLMLVVLGLGLLFPMLRK